MNKTILCTIIFLSMILVVCTIELSKNVDRQIWRYVISDFFNSDKNVNLLIGSSTIMRTKNSYLHCGKWLNRGIGGSKVDNLKKYLFFTPLNIKPEKIVVYAGENDVAFGVNTSDVVEGICGLITNLIDKFENVDIYLIALKFSPSRKRHWKKFNEVNGMLKNIYKKDDNVNFLWAGELNRLNTAYFVSDGVHLNEYGYEVFYYRINALCKNR